MPPTATPTPGGTLVGVCGQYTVYQNGTTYSAAGWSDAIKVGTNCNNTLTGGSGPELMLGLGGNDLLRGNGGDDVLCGGDGVDLLLGHVGNDLLDGDGVRNATGGAGNDLFTLVLRNGWRDGDGQPRFNGLTAGYGNDVVGLAILNSAPFLVDISGDERHRPCLHPHQV